MLHLLPWTPRRNGRNSKLFFDMSLCIRVFPFQVKTEGLRVLDRELSTEEDKDVRVRVKLLLDRYVCLTGK